jgi:hypothetical protein
VIEKSFIYLGMWAASAHSPPVASLAAYSVSDPSRATRAQIVGTDGAVRPGTGLRRSDFAPLVST